jgi:hypothetical protein
MTGDYRKARQEAGRQEQKERKDQSKPDSPEILNN